MRVLKENEHNSASRFYFEKVYTVVFGWSLETIGFCSLSLMVLLTMKP